MRRRVLVTIAALGGVVTLLGLTGLIAPNTDRAQTGTNRANSSEVPVTIDLQLATLDGVTGCGPFSDDLTSGLHSVTDFQPGMSHQAFFCIRNVGTGTASLSASTVNVRNTELACTGDEALYDATCVPGQSGELSRWLTVGFSRIIDCQAAWSGTWVNSTVERMQTTPAAFDASWNLRADDTKCFAADLRYDPSTPSASQQAAQTDEVTWQYAFDGAVA